jgi:serine/threonine protein kinase
MSSIPANSENDATFHFLKDAPPLDEPTMAHGDVTRSEQPAASSSMDTIANSFGDYVLESEIARGGMGVVYKARQKRLNRTVAIKMILAGKLASSDDVKRFYVEAEAAAKLEHPNIVPIYEIGELAGQHFFSMGFVDGGSLDRLLADKTLSPEMASRLMVEIANAIAYAHERNIVHRDLKPANILLSRSPATSGSQVSTLTESGSSGRSQVSLSKKQKRASELEWIPKVTDFGLAKQLESASDLTGTGQILGTPSYMPPEQAAGDNLAIGPCSDVYSLGAILYRMLAGRAPFQGSSPLETIMQVIKQDPVSIRQLNSVVPKDLETICMKCLQKDPAKRYESANALANDLNRWLNGDPIEARPMPASERALRWLKKHPAISSSFAIAVVSIASIVGVLSLSNRKLTEQRDVAIQAELTAETQRNLAQARLVRAIEAIDRMMARAGTERWTKSPEMEEERKILLQGAVQFYRSLIADREESSLVRWEAAKAYEQVAGALYVLNDLPGSTEACEQATQLLDQLLKDSPRDSRYLLKKSEVVHLQSIVAALASNRVADSTFVGVVVAREAVRVAKQASEIDSESVEIETQVVNTMSHAAYFCMSGNDKIQKEGRDSLEELEHRIAKLRTRAGNSMVAKLAIAFALNVTSAYAVNGGDMEAGKNGYLNAKALVDELQNQPAPDALRADHYLHVRAMAYLNLGFCIFYHEKGNRDGLTTMEDGLLQLQNLVRIHPRNLLYRLQLFQALNAKSSVYAALKETEQARDAQARATELLSEIAKDNPELQYIQTMDQARESVQLVKSIQSGDVSNLERRIQEIVSATGTKNRFSVMYNVACAYCQASKVDKANREAYVDKGISILQELRAEGLLNQQNEIQHAQSDPDLAELREDPRWLELLKD